MDKCYTCGKIIYDDSSNYRKRLENVRKEIKDKNIKMCDCCIGKFNKSRNKIVLENILLKSMSNVINRNFY